MTESLDAQLTKKKLHPPYDCPYYFNNWNMDECCNLTDGDYCQFCEFTGCPEYNELFGIKIKGACE